MRSAAASPWFQVFLSLSIVATAIGTFNEITARSYSRALGFGRSGGEATKQPPPPPPPPPRPPTPRPEPSHPVATSNKQTASLAVTTPGGAAVAPLPAARDVVDRGALRTLRDPSGGVTAVAFAPNRASLLAAAGEDRTIRLWNVNTGLVERTLAGHDSGVTSLVFSPDGRSIASGSADNTVRIWDVATGEARQVLTGADRWVFCVAWSPDGRIVAAGSGDGAVRLWDARSGAPLRTLIGHQRWVSALGFSPDGQLLASGSGDFVVRLWRVSSGAELPSLRLHQGYVKALAWAPDGKTIATGSADMTIGIGDPWSGTQVRSMSSGQGAIYAVAFTDSRTLAAGAYNGRLQFFDVASGQPLQTVAAHTQSIAAMALAPGGHQLVTAGADGAIRLWQIRAP